MIRSILTRRQVLVGATLAAAAAGGARGQPTSPAWQADLRSAMAELSMRGRYLPLLRLAETNLPPEMDQQRRQWSAFWGDEREALQAAAGQSDGDVDLDAVRAEPALVAVARQARGRRVVIVNEAHTASRHRQFIGAALAAVRPAGFTRYAAETFSDDPTLGTLGFGDPIRPSLGWYTLDPVFAEAVRGALAEGYRLAAYEASAAVIAGAGGGARIARREAHQAETIARMLEDRAAGGVFVHVGHSHLAERPDAAGNLWMAARLRELTGEDPLTVSQDASGSYGPHAPDNPLTRKVLERFRPAGPIVLRRASGGYIGDARLGSDMLVFHPRRDDIAGRPGWLAADLSRRRLEVPWDGAARRPVLAQALPAAESGPCVPADQFAPAADQRRLTFFLRPGRYRIQLEHLDGVTDLGDFIVR